MVVGVVDLAGSLAVLDFKVAVLSVAMSGVPEVLLHGIYGSGRVVFSGFSASVRRFTCLWGLLSSRCIILVDCIGRGHMHVA
jgi:hypothetical protein